jgi:hypothetical protein
MKYPISFRNAKILKEKGWKSPTLHFYFEDGELKENTLQETTGMDYGSVFEIEASELFENWNDGWLTKKTGRRCFGCSKSQGYLETFSAPTVYEVLMWLYDEHEIWITAEPSVNDDGTITNIYKIFKGGRLFDISRISSGFRSLEGAYDAAIFDTLDELI